jgi:hypothetical protein
MIAHLGLEQENFADEMLRGEADLAGAPLTKA